MIIQVLKYWTCVRLWFGLLNIMMYQFLDTILVDEKSTLYFEVNIWLLSIK